MHRRGRLTFMVAAMFARPDDPVPREAEEISHKI